MLFRSKALDGDVRRGQSVFLGQKAACYNCHKIGYRGGEVGPDLTSISKARTERDLLEAIVYPSASFVRSYEPVIVRLKDDTEVSGILRSESDKELVVVPGPGAEQRIPRADVAEVRPGTVSLMPAGLIDSLLPEERLDLFRFLAQLGKPGEFDAARGGVARLWKLYLITSGNQQIGRAHV